mgnify:CR=1 FL=1
MTDILDIRGISKSFGALQASDDISLSLKAGEIHALIGPNGAGKSTLINQIAGGLKPDSGTVNFNGQNITTLAAPDRARLGLARTFQISQLASEMTVLQNAVFGALGADGRVSRFWQPVMKDKALLEAANSALNRVGLSHRSRERVSEISHGERRQLEVAVALSQHPKAFLMDEPMAGLGHGGSERLTVFLRELKHEAPILLVEHDMDAVFALADRISVLVYGKIIATGTADEIRSNPLVREAYLGEEGDLA